MIDRARLDAMAGFGNLSITRPLAGMTPRLDTFAVHAELGTDAARPAAAGMKSQGKENVAG